MAEKATTENLRYTVPGMSTADGATVVNVLQDRLNAFNDLHLTLKHVHWNVVGPNFISVHEMLDPQVDNARDFADEVAERIATLGGSPKGTPGTIVSDRTWEDYSIGRSTAIEHLGALNVVYEGVISSMRDAIDTVGEVDPITEDILIGQSRQLEQNHWFVRAHLENSKGELSTHGATSEKKAAAEAAL